uniref:Si:dkey-181c13.1 n=1 Tax=Cyprinus carpio TaxID=7962 RepID=A0A8C2IR39_CYPCA
LHKRALYIHSPHLQFLPARDSNSQPLDCKGDCNKQWFSYYISSEWKNWTDSRRDCLQRGADLVTSANIVWIGLTDSDNEGVWKWVDGSTPNEPNGKVGDEDCAVSQYSWADFPCNYTFVWICERN